MRFGQKLKLAYNLALDHVAKAWALPKNKRGAGGIVGDTVFKIGGLIVGVVVLVVILAALFGAGIITSGSAEDNVTQHLKGNFYSGIDNIAGKLPTILLVVAIVFLVGALMLLWGLYKRMNAGGGQNGGTL